MARMIAIAITASAARASRLKAFSQRNLTPELPAALAAPFKAASTSAVSKNSSAPIHHTRRRSELTPQCACD